MISSIHNIADSSNVHDVQDLRLTQSFVIVHDSRKELPPDSPESNFVWTTIRIREENPCYSATECLVTAASAVIIPLLFSETSAVDRDFERKSMF
jgi:hypothetical protein